MHATVTAPAVSARLKAYRALVAALAVADLRTPEQIADLIRVEGITGERDSIDNSPVGTWLCAEAGGHAYTWCGEEFAVYDGRMVLLAQARIASGAVYDLECLVNDLEPGFLDLLAHGDDDPR